MTAACTARGRGRPGARAQCRFCACTSARASPPPSSRSPPRPWRWWQRERRFDLDELALRVPGRARPRGRDPTRWLRRLVEGGLAWRYGKAGSGTATPRLPRSRPHRRRPKTRPPTVRAQIEHELALIAELGYEPYFLTVHDIVRFALRARHPVPGPRLGGQLGGVLGAGHHRGRPAAGHHAGRALHLASATSRPTSTSTSSTSAAREVIQYL